MFVDEALAKRLVPDELWELVRWEVPEFAVRAQGGGTAPVDARVVFTAIVFVLVSGCPWRLLPRSFGVSPATAHRRFQAWVRAGVFARMQRRVLDAAGVAGLIDWTSVLVDAAAVRAKKGAR